MTVRELRDLLSVLPDAFLDQELTLFSVNDGQKFTVRNDVGQFAMMGGGLSLYIKKRLDPIYE